MASKPCNPYRESLTAATAAIIRDSGFGSAEPAALESLVEMTQSFITQIGKSSKHYSELANRSQVMVTDLSLSLIDSGISLEELRVYTEINLRKPTTLAPPSQEPDVQKPKPLSVNSGAAHPTYVHDGLPPFPDKHTYIQTPAHRHAATDYQLVRQKESMQRKNTENALTKFIAKTGESNYYCDDEKNPINESFQLVACKPSPLSYLSALLPKDEEVYEVFDLKQEQGFIDPPTKKLKTEDSNQDVQMKIDNETK